MKDNGDFIRINNNKEYELCQLITEKVRIRRSGWHCSYNKQNSGNSNTIDFPNVQ